MAIEQANKKFCGERCQKDDANERARASRQLVKLERLCEHCGNVTERPKYCCGECAKSARNERVKQNRNHSKVNTQIELLRICARETCGNALTVDAPVHAKYCGVDCRTIVKTENARLARQQWDTERLKRLNADNRTRRHANKVLKEANSKLAQAKALTSKTLAAPPEHYEQRIREQHLQISRLQTAIEELVLDTNTLARKGLEIATAANFDMPPNLLQFFITHARSENALKEYIEDLWNYGYQP